MTALTTTERRIFGTAALCALAIAAYRASTGGNMWLFAANGASVIPLLVPWFWKRFLEYGDSLPPATPKAFAREDMPFWWRYVDVYLVVAAALWISSLLALSIQSIPRWVWVDLFMVTCAGPMVVVGIASIVEAIFRRHVVPPS